MADTLITPNNQQVRFRGRGEKMPSVSQAQRGAMASAAEGKSKLGIPEKVGKEFIAADEGGKLPEYANDKADQLHKRGLISDDQHKKLRAKAAKAKKVSDPEPADKVDPAKENDDGGHEYR